MTDYAALGLRLMEVMEQVSRNAPHRVLQNSTKGEVFLLNYLHNRGGTARPGEMSAAMEASTARVAAAINSMQRKGWVVREVDTHDHRKALVHLTPEGDRYVGESRQRILDGLVQLLTALGREAAEEYIFHVSRLVELHNQARSKLEGNR